MDDRADPVAALDQLLDGLPKQLTRPEKLDALERCALLLARAPLGSVDVFAPPIRHKLEFNKDTVILKVQQVRVGSGGSSKSEAPAFEPSAADIERATALLRDPGITDRFIHDMAALGVVGEESNLLVLLLTLVSRLLKRPISIVVKSASSAGKSFLVNAVLSTLPPNQYVVFTAASAKALYFRTDPLKHKVLAFMERPGAEGSDYQVRVLQSEGQLIYSVAEKDPDTGQIVAVDKVVEGPVAYIETTTQATLHDENETRLFSISLDESTQATEAILLEQGRRAACPVDTSGDSVVRVWQTAHSLLKPGEVTIPFAQRLAQLFPAKRVRARRDFPRFLALIEASTLLHQVQRERNTQGKLLATIADYALARRLAKPLLEAAVYGATEKTRKLVDAARNLADTENPADPTSVTITASKLSKRLLTSGWSKKTIQRHLKAADQAGYLDLHSAKRGQDNEYRLADVHNESSLFLPSPNELETESSDAEVGQPGQGASNVDDAPNQAPLKQIGEVRQPGQEVDGEAPLFDFGEDVPPAFRDPDL